MSVRGFFGGLFLAIGWLITVLSGGCSITFSIFAIGNNTPLSDLFGLVIFAGGPPFVIGLVLIFIGRLVWGKSKPDNLSKNPYAIPEEMRENEKRHLKENLKKDNPFIDEEN